MDLLYDGHQCIIYDGHSTNFMSTMTNTNGCNNLEYFCDNYEKTIQNLLFGDSTENLFNYLYSFHSIIEKCNINEESLQLVDADVLKEIKEITNRDETRIYFGKKIRDIKCIIQDQGFREHEILITYRGRRKLCISNVRLPYNSLQDKEYASMGDIITAFNTYIKDLACYFQELELIDEHCTVVEPAKPSFKDDYRKILLDDRVWLHVEVTPEGLATNIQIVGQAGLWQNKLQQGLLTWDHDKNIITNIMKVFDIAEFPKNNKNVVTAGLDDEDSAQTDLPTCSICLCVELPDVPGMPQPLCQNTKCGVYYHRNCLYQWLLACAGNRPPTFGVATGSCPTCLRPIVCNAKDN